MLSLSSALTSHRRSRIVAVDDDPRIRALLRFSVGLDHDLVAVGTADEALVALGEARADALVLDLNLPTADGVELLRRVKEDPARFGRPIVVVVSGSQDEERRRRVERLGVEAWFAKPFDPELLQGTVELLVHAICCAEPALPAVERTDDHVPAA